MAHNAGNRPAEIFGYPPADRSKVAQQTREQHWCPFVDKVCNKRSRLIDYVLVKHKPMQAEVQDFVTVEFQTDSTTGTGKLVQGLRDFVAGQDIQKRTYSFGMNTYDTIKRS
jgi:hypothetical protein